MTGSKAIYECKQCGTQRQYGHIAPPNTYKPKLNCELCKAVQPHKFVEVVRFQ